MDVSRHKCLLLLKSFTSTSAECLLVPGQVLFVSLSGVREQLALLAMRLSRAVKKPNFAEVICRRYRLRDHGREEARPG